MMVAATATPRELTGNVAHVTGELTLSRIDFKVGTGSTWGIDWASERSPCHPGSVYILR